MQQTRETKRAEIGRELENQRAGLGASCLGPPLQQPRCAATAGLKIWLAATLVTLMIVATTVTWFACDRRVPSADEADHLLNGWQYTTLFQHAHPFRLSWWHALLSVNQFYPPAVYLYNGLLKLFLPSTRWVDNATFITYTAVLWASTFGIAWRATRSLPASALAALLLSCYPQVVHESHVYMLDLPLAAMVTAGVLSLMWWEEKPSWPRTVATGLVLAAACLTKQLGALYLASPCVVLLASSLRNGKLPRLLTIGAIVAVPLLAWLAVNADWIRHYAQENAAVMGNAAQTPPAVFKDYLLGLTCSMSFCLTAAFLLCVWFVPGSAHRFLRLLYTSSLGGLILASLLTCTFALDRYATAALVVPAILTAAGSIRLLNKHKAWGVTLLAFIGVTACAQVASFAWSPYPIASRELSKVASALGVGLREFRGARIVQSAPQQHAGEQTWVMETIAARDGGAAVWLNVLPSYGPFSPHSFNLLAREMKLKVKATTSRVWTIMGDRVDFSPETAMYFHWYLFKTGYQGNILKDKKSESNYAALQRYVETSGKFERVADRQLSDGSTITLYRQK